VRAGAQPDEQHSDDQHRKGRVDGQRERPDGGDDGPAGDDPDGPQPVGERSGGKLRQRIHQHQPGERRADDGRRDAVGVLERPEQRREGVPEELREKPDGGRQRQHVEPGEATQECDRTAADPRGHPNGRRIRRRKTSPGAADIVVRYRVTA
jgi:hypothetical protein